MVYVRRTGGQDQCPRVLTGRLVYTCTVHAMPTITPPESFERPHERLWPACRRYRPTVEWYARTHCTAWPWSSTMIGWSRCFKGDTGGYLVAFGVSLAKSYGEHLML
jgi:hypothetical protein